MSEFKQYQRKQIAELRAWSPDDDMTRVSVSAPDREAGSPKLGDRIARNPKNHDDQWLVAEAYFRDNFAPVNSYNPTDRVQRGSALMAGPIKIATYRVRDPITDEWSSLQFHMTFDNTVMAVMGFEAAKLFTRFAKDVIDAEERKS